MKAIGHCWHFSEALSSEQEEEKRWWQGEMLQESSFWKWFLEVIGGCVFTSPLDNFSHTASIFQVTLVHPENLFTSEIIGSLSIWYAQNSKFSNPGLNSTWTVNFQMFKVDLGKAEEPKIKLPTSTGSSKKQESSRKTSTSALLTMPKLLTVWITTAENSSRDRNTRPPDLPPEKSVCRSGSKS